MQADEIARTGITSLKVRFNSVFGYYIEVTKSNLDKVPPHYIRKQTVANGERYITPELKEMEGKILGAEERSVKLEYELFQRVREEVLGQLPKIQQTAAALAQLDVLASFAETARLHSYCRPVVADEGVLQIRDGRHPVLEQNLADERFVPNDAGLCGAAGSPACRNVEDQSDTAPAQAGASFPPNRAHHRAEHGGQKHLHPAGGAHHAAGAHRLVRARQPRRGLTWWIASSPASARATILRADNPRSWSK